jgi:branched-chain amino acid transport system ATP-binding protein
MFEATGIRAGYGAADVLDDIEVSVAPGRIAALVGANGSGKSTLVNVLAGSLARRGGTLRVDGDQHRRWSTSVAVRCGVVLVPEGRHIFADLSVHDNLLLGGWSGRRKPAEIAARFDQVLTLFPVLKDRLASFAGLLSGGQQQMLAIGRGLMAGPRYLILDEPSLGLAPIVVDEIFEAIRTLSKTEVGVLLAEQNGRAALELADTGFLVERGRITLQGPGRELLAHPEITDRFLGGHTSGVVNDTGLYDRIARALGV